MRNVCKHFVKARASLRVRPCDHYKVDGSYRIGNCMCASFDAFAID